MRSKILASDGQKELAMGKIISVFVGIFAGMLAFPGNLSAAPHAERLAVEARVKADMAKDLAQPYEISTSLKERKCLDGRLVKDFQGEVIEYWSNLECPYCGIAEPLKAQRDNSDICIVIRHAPASQYGEALKKALAFEALRIFSVNAANRFWDGVIPKTSLAIPMPYEASLRSAMEEALISPEAFADAIEKVSAQISGDILAGQSRISATPTYVMRGIRFPACDFKSNELPKALELAKKARAKDETARLEIVKIITRGLLDENLL